MYSYKTRGTCSTEITYDIAPDGTITDVQFRNGCRGNLQGISRLVEGKTPEEVVFLLKGVECRGKTSCPDQLACAMEDYISKHEDK